MLYWVRDEGRWRSVFITTDDIPRDHLNQVVGEIYNIRRLRSHKKLRICWRNLIRERVNPNTNYFMPNSELLFYRGSFPVDF